MAPVERFRHYGAFFVVAAPWTSYACNILAVSVFRRKKIRIVRIARGFMSAIGPLPFRCMTDTALAGKLAVLTALGAVR